MSDKQYFWYLSFISGVLYSVPMIIFIFSTNFIQYDSFFDVILSLLFALLYLLVLFSFGPIFVFFFKLVCGNYTYTLIDANFNKNLLLNYPKAIKLYHITLEKMEDFSPTNKFKKLIDKENKKFIYSNLAICYNELSDKENRDKYLEKFLEFFPENKRELRKDNIIRKYHFNKEVKKITFEKRVIKICSRILVVTYILCLVISFIKPAYPNIKFIAGTDDLTLANSIQEFLTSYNSPTVRIKDGTIYKISLYNVSDKVARAKAVELADSMFASQDFTIYSGVRFNKNKKRYEKNMNRSYRKTINMLSSVSDCKVDIDIKPASMSIPDVKANVIIDVYENANQKAIEKIVKNLLVRGIAGLTEDNIKVTFNNIADNQSSDTHYPISTLIYYDLAREFYRNGLFNKARIMLFEAQDREPHYMNSIVALEKMQELNKEIKKYPNDYQLYIQRGDLENVDEYSLFIDESSITSDYYSAIIDYEKALELNPNAYEVFEKLGHAYENCGYQKAPGYRLEKTDYEYTKAIENYEKAIKYCKNSDCDYLYQKIADIYRKNNNIQKAIEYYSMIKDLYPTYSDNDIPIPDGKSLFQIDAGYYSTPALELARLNAKLGYYDKSLDILNNSLEKLKTKNDIQEAKNLIFLYNWKAKHYKKAFKNGNDCSAFICRVMTFELIQK